MTISMWWNKSYRN